MNSFLKLLVLTVLTICQAIAVEPEREWLTDEEMGKQIFAREVILPVGAVPEMTKEVAKLKH